MTTPAQVGQRAAALLDLGRPQEAATQLHQALAQTPGDAVLWQLLFTAHTALDQHEQALEAARQALAWAPDDADSHAILGVALWNTRVLGRRHGSLFSPARRASGPALAALREALRLEPGNAGFRVTLGGMLLQVGGEPEAETHFQAALRSEPHCMGAQLGLAEVALWRKHAQEAHERASRVLVNEPLHTGAMQLLARAALLRGDGEAALATALAAVKLDPVGPRGHAQLEALIEAYLPRPFGDLSPARRVLVVPQALPVALVVAAFVWLRTLYRLHRLSPGVRAPVVTARRRMAGRHPRSTRVMVGLVILLALLTLLTSVLPPSLKDRGTAVIGLVMMLIMLGMVGWGLFCLVRWVWRGAALLLKRERG